MGLISAFDSFENIFRAMAVVEAYPAINVDLEMMDSPSRYWKRAISDIEQLINFNADKMILAMDLLPPERKERYHANFQDICAAMDENRLFEAGSQPGFHSKRVEVLNSRIARQANGAGVRNLYPV